MSLLINKELIWVAIPRCASTSIERSFIDSEIEIEHISYPNFKEKFKEGIFYEKPHHHHYKLSHLRDYFGQRKSVCIKRDWFERWMSALSHFWDLAQNRNYETVIKFEEIDNDFIYSVFDKTFANTLLTDGGLPICTSKLIKNSNLLSRRAQNNSHLFLSQHYWTDGVGCDYEFDINHFDEFENFINQKFNCKIKFYHTNSSAKKESKIVIDDELKNHIWETFEKQFYKSKKNII